jgi:hypothetical protein
MLKGCRTPFWTTADLESKLLDFKTYLTIIARIAHGRGDQQTTHRLGGSRTSNLVDGKLTAEDCIKPRYLLDPYRL